MGTLSEVCGGPSSGLSLAGLKQHERDQEKESQQRSACFGHFSSTAAVYGNPERLPVREDDATVPTSPYGSSKADDRDHAARRRRHPRPAPRDSALLQRRRRRPARSHRPVDQKGQPRQRQLPTACGKQASPFPTFSMLRSIRKIWLRSANVPL
jgi:hypothetical protein